MFKKILFAFSLFFLLTFPVSALSFRAGDYQATVDANIRISPSKTGRRVGHVKKGDPVAVIQSSGQWCLIRTKRNLRAYVYCPLLKPETKKTPTKDIKYTTYHSQKYQYSFDEPQIFDPGFIYEMIEDYSFEPILPEILQHGNLSFSFDTYATPEQYEKLFSDSFQLEKTHSEKFTTVHQENFDLDYFKMKDNPNKIVINGRYTKFPIPGNIFTFIYNKNKAPQGETIFKHMLHSTQRKNGLPVKTYVDQENYFLLQHPASWEVFQGSSLSSNIPESTIFAVRDNEKNADFFANVSVTKMQLGKNISSLEYAEEVIAKEKNGLEQFREIKRSTFALQKRGSQEIKGTMIWFDAKMESSGKTLSFVQTFATDGTSGYTITASASPDEKATTQKALEDVVQSFTILPHSRTLKF